MNLGQAERRGTNVQPERIEDGLGAHVQAADEHSAARHDKERNQQNESAD
jgi:hypothetical protein